MTDAGSWSRLEDVLAKLRARWDRGTYLRAYAERHPWTPVSLSLKSPNAADLLENFDAAMRWIERLRESSHTPGGTQRFAIEYRTVRSRALGVNEVPARLRIDTIGELAALLGTAQDITRLDSILGSTRDEFASLVPWIAAHPIDVLANYDVWDRLLLTVGWIVDHDTSTSDIRHLDIPGADTKFVEKHRKILGRLLEQVLPSDRMDLTTPGFAARYGFRPRPKYVRLRLLAPVPNFPTEITELEVRVDELARGPLPTPNVFIVENKASYLAFPNAADAIVIFGEGFGVTTLEAVPWLAERQLVYWGDIDTHGFAILHRLRERIPAVQSILMDRETLLVHQDQLVTETNPTSAALTHLTHAEAELYRDLVEDRFGRAVRLEQERVRFSCVQRALAPWTASSPSTEQQHHPELHTGSPGVADDVP